MTDGTESRNMDSAIRIGFNWPTVKLVILFLIGSLFVYTLGIAVVVSVFYFPHAYNFYISEILVYSVLAMAPADLFHRAILYSRTGRLQFIIHGIRWKLFGISYLITVVPILLAVLYEYVTGFLSFL